MKKIIIILAIISMAFVSCDKNEVEKIESNATTTSYYCRHCKSNDIKVFYPPRNMSHLPPSYVCNVCGEGGNLYPDKKQ